MPDARILIVEDEGIEALDLQNSLISMGYNVIDIVSTGEEAVIKAGEIRPDLVLMDIMLQGEIDGVTAAEQIHARFNIPVIFTTAYADENTLQRAKITEPYGYLVKPFHEKELHISVDIAIYKHKMERKLKESEEWLAITLRSIGDGVIATDKNGLITFMNPVAEGLVGRKQKEVLNKKLTDVFKIINRDTRLPIENPVTRVLSEGITSELASHTILIRNGTEILIDDSAAPIKDDKGNNIGVVLVFRDITERKHAEGELAKTKALLETLLTQAPIGFAYFDRDLRYLLINDRLAEMNGLPAAAHLGKTVAEIGPSLLPAMQQVVAQILATGEPVVGYEFSGETPLQPGATRYWSESWYPVRDMEGQVTGFGAVVEEITARKQAEKALREAHDTLEQRVQERTADLQKANKALIESEASYRELTESIDDLFYAMDGDLGCTYWNKACEALTGISAKDAIGKSLFELFPDIKGTKIEQFYIKSLKEQQPERLESEYHIGDKKIIFELNAYPTKTGLSVIAKDITEQKNLESQLLRAQRMESIGTLAGGMAHDLNNMLTPMMMSLQTLKRKLKDEQSQRLLTTLENNSQRSADLIKQVLSFARGVEGEHNPLQAKHLISEIRKIAKETFPRNIEIRTDVQKDLFTISGDVTQLHQVLMNLCVNSRDAMPDGGILKISAENFLIDKNYARMHTDAKVGSYVAIMVSDTGIGIPPKIVDRIFEPFFTTKEFGKGTGLGLSTALAIVKSHGGFINVYSEVGKGTIFRVYLPAIKAEMQNVEEQHLELLTGHEELVLVAEDEDSVREVTVFILEGYGYNVLAANNGADAVALYAKNKDKIEVVLMDMMMPVMDGEASVRAIRKINPEAKVIVVSGLAEKDKLAKIESTHAQALLPKPYTAERLLKAMHEVLSAK